MTSFEVVNQIEKKIKMETVSNKSLESNSRKKSRSNINISSGPEGKIMFGCEICGKIFANNTKLTQHISVIHEGKKPFKCDICNYSCSQKSSMKTHVASVHEGNKPFKCDICDYGCTRKSIMNKHVASVHKWK